MTLKAACEIAIDCGLETVDEAVLNIQLHANSIFGYDEISSELHELEIAAEKYPINTFISDILVDA